MDSKKRILVVDDEPLVAQLCKHVLTLDGHETATARTGEAALDLVDQEKFDLMLVDLRLPGINGWDTFRATRRRFPEMAAILMTGYGSKETVVAALKAGFDDFLDKPFTADQLVLVVQQVIERRTEKLAAAQAHRLLEIERDALVSLLEASTRSEVIRTILAAAKSIPGVTEASLLVASEAGWVRFEGDASEAIANEQLPAIGNSAIALAGTALAPLWAESGCTRVGLMPTAESPAADLLCLAVADEKALSPGSLATGRRLAHWIDQASRRLA